jgi:hypothetical protein
MLRERAPWLNRPQQFPLCNAAAALQVLALPVAAQPLFCACMCTSMHVHAPMHANAFVCEQYESMIARLHENPCILLHFHRIT